MEVPPNQLAAGGLVAALLLTLLFAFSYVGALHDPHPHRMPVAVIEPRSAAAIEASNGMFVPRTTSTSPGSAAGSDSASRSTRTAC
jgi:hypothetical protein